MKKYFSDSLRKVCSVQSLLEFKTNNEEKKVDDQEPKEIGGAILTVERGPRIEQLCIVTKFSSEWINHPEFKKLIEPFTSTPKSSRFILINTEAKSWGASKVDKGKALFNSIINPFLETPPTARVVDLSPPVEEVKTEETKLRIVPKKKQPISINTNIEKVENEISSPRYDTEGTYSDLKDLLSTFNDQIEKLNQNLKILKRV